MKKISLAILTLLVAMTACKKVPEVNLKYVDVERDLITVGTTTATVQCDYKYIATLKKAYFYYGEGEDENNMNTAEMHVVQNTLYVDLAGLKSNTTYSYFYEFHNGFNSMRTVAKTFKTETTPVIVILPSVITAEVNEIAEYSAQCGGEVTNDGGAEVKERGICWSTNENPTLNDNHVAAGSGLGAFTALMDSLQDNTTYHVRAYATNEVGTAYGLDREFVTLVFVPDGAINGLFTINDNGDRVYFSQGNLQYQASTNTWRFAEHQWDYVGGIDTLSGELYGNVFNNGIKSDNALVSPSYDGWIDLFGWGTSGFHDANDLYNINYQPWSTSINTVNTNCCNFFGYGPSTTMSSPDLTGSSASYDWGVNNSICNGGNYPNQWRTPTFSEFDFIFNLRTSAKGTASVVNGTMDARFAMAIVNDVSGIILFPDNYNHPDGISQPEGINSAIISFAVNNYSNEAWASMEYAGCVFIPASGSRYNTGFFQGTSIHQGIGGYYWTSSHYNGGYSYYDGECAYRLGFMDEDVFISNLDFNLYQRQHGGRRYGESVRLIQDANP